MNRSESKYFNTASKMDEAFLELLEHKDFAYITVKEICEKAGVNRSTFYLHYETIEDLLEESIQLVFDRFLAHMKMDQESIVQRIYDCPIEQLNLVTPEHLTPYLSYIRANKRLFGTAVEKATVLRMEAVYGRMPRRKKRHDSVWSHTGWKTELWARTVGGCVWMRNDRYRGSSCIPIFRNG